MTGICASKGVQIKLGIFERHGKKLSNLLKVAEQRDDFVGWNESNCAYILTHGVSASNGAIIAIHFLIQCTMST